MRSYLHFLWLALMVADMSGAASVGQREISTQQANYRVCNDAWPKGLFYGIEDTLYWLRLHDRQLLIRTLSKGEIDGAWTIDLRGAPDNLRMTDVTSTEKHALFALFSGHENLIVRINLNQPDDIRRIAIPITGYAHTIRHIAGLDSLAVVLGQTLALLVNEDGSVNRFGPEISHGNNCCTYAAAAVSGDAIALNVNGGLRLYSGDLEEIIWGESGSGKSKRFIREVASAGEVWAAIDSSTAEGIDGIRLFLPHGREYFSHFSPLPMADGSLGMADEEWRVTDCGDRAIVWSRRSDVMFRVSEKFVDLFRLDKNTPRGRACPGHSDRLFLIDSEGYTVIVFN